jgi:hypothetical protein
MIGKINHASMVLPMSRYFLGELRTLFQLAKHDKSRLKLNNRAIEALNLWKEFLHKSNKGVNMNMISSQLPANITITDACPAEIGGFSVRSGRSWRVPVPDCVITSNSILEYSASIVSIMMELREGIIPNMGQLIVISNNTSAVGWLVKFSTSPSINKELYDLYTYLASTCLNIPSVNIFKQQL